MRLLIFGEAQEFRRSESKEKAKKTLNKNLNIKSENLAIIPTEYKTEILCYEFKGTVENREFIVYINAKTGEEEDILVIYNTPNGVLTMQPLLLSQVPEIFDIEVVNGTGDF